MLKKRYSFSLAILACIVIAFLVYYFVLRDNIHTVIPNKVYRSAQINGDKLQSVLKKYSIKSILNLRGIGPGQYWYDNEMKTAKSFNIKHITLSLKANSVVSVQQLKQLTTAIENAPKPVLIHCKEGSDRTGLAAAIAVILYGKPNISTIKEQYSLKYLAISAHTNGKLTMPYYFCWLEKNNLTPNKANFKQWLKQLKPGINYPTKNKELISSYLADCHV